MSIHDEALKGIPALAEIIADDIAQFIESFELTDYENEDDPENPKTVPCYMVPKSEVDLLKSKARAVAENWLARKKAQ
jgi:hypothetical protein